MYKDLIIPHFLRLILMLWLILAALTGIVIGIGYMLPPNLQLAYMNQRDQQHPSIFLRDYYRNLEHRLTKRYGMNWFKSWSPNGELIAYFSSDRSTYDLYIMDAFGQHNRRYRLDTVGLGYAIIWSPDSKEILVPTFSAEGVAQTILLNIIDGRTRIFPYYIGQGGIFSPDGQSIIYNTAIEDQIANLYEIDVNCEPCTPKQLDILHNQFVYSFGMPNWSPDGHTIAFGQKDTNDSKIVAARLRCADLLEACVEGIDTIANTPLYDASPIWSPDGKQLAFISISSNLYIVNVETGESHPLNTPGIAFIKDWSPDGKLIAYLAKTWDMDPGTMYVINVVTNQSQPLFSDHPANAFPAWRPIPH